MTDRQHLSKGELEVARVLWSLKRATVREVYESMPSGREMDFATVQTYLRRLEKKGYLKADLNGRVRVYSAKVRPKTVIRETVDDFIDRLFGGDALPLVEHLIEERGITGQDIEALKSLLEKNKKQAGANRTKRKGNHHGGDSVD